MTARLSGTTRYNCILHEVRIHACPIVRLLSTHREALNYIQCLNSKVPGQELILSIYTVPVVEGFGEIGGVGRRGRFTVSEHSNDNHVVG